MIVLPSVSSGVISSSFFDPKKISGLALWLKADTGVSKFTYNYISQIIITGTSNPSFAGTYTADGVPTYNFDEQFVNTYVFTGPAGKTMSWSPDDGYFLLSSSGEPSDSFYSTDGVNWSPSEEYVSSITVTGFTGIYTGANGTYNGDGYYFTKEVGGGFFIQGNELKDTASESVIATAPANYSGPWTAGSYDSSVTLTGAGTTSANGVYTRTDTEVSMTFVIYVGSGEMSIFRDQYWFVRDNSEEGTLLYQNDYDLINWEVLYGDPDAPTGSIGTSTRSVGSPTSTTLSKPTGSISGSVTISTVNTDDLTDWADQSGNGRSLNADGESKPTYTIIGGKSFVNLAAGSRLFLSNVIWSDVEFIGTIFFVARFNSSSAGVYGSVLFHQEGNNGNLYFIRGIASTNNFYITKNDGADVVSSNVLADNNTNYILSTTFNASTASLYLNGASAGSGPISSSTGYPVNSSIGYDQTEQFNVAEAIIYNRVLTTPERQQVEAYLNAKYVIY